jgi:hypothetical protein
MRASSSAAAAHGKNQDYQPLPMMSIKQENFTPGTGREKKAR